jgi:hypothetical protein
VIASYPLAFLGALLSFGPCLAQELLVPTNPDVSFGQRNFFQPSDQIFMKNGLDAYGKYPQSDFVLGQLITIVPDAGGARMAFVQPGGEQWPQMAADPNMDMMLRALPQYRVLPQYYVDLNGELSWEEASRDFQFDLGQLTDLERTEYQDLVARYDDLSPLELKRLNELSKKGMTVVGGTPPERPKVPVAGLIPPKPQRTCPNGNKLPKWCEYLEIESEFCICPED